MPKLLWFFAALGFSVFATSEGLAEVYLRQGVVICAGASSPTTNCKSPEKDWLSPKDGEHPPSLKVIGAKSFVGKNHLQVEYHYTRTLPETGMVVNMGGTAWILDDPKVIHADDADRGAFKAPVVVAEPKAEVLSQPKPAELTVAAADACPDCSLHKEPTRTLISDGQKVLDESLAYVAQEKDNERYNLDLDTLNSLLSETGKCMPPKPDKVLMDYDQCNGAKRGGNNFAYDCNFVYGWNKLPEPKLPPITFKDQWGLPPHKTRRLTKKDLQIIDGLARTIWGETRSCFAKVKTIKSGNSINFIIPQDMTDSGGHAEMAATVLVSRALLIQKQRELNPPFSSKEDIRWREFARPDDKLAAMKASEAMEDDPTKPFSANLHNPLESVYSEPSAFSMWNSQKIETLFKIVKDKNGKPILDENGKPKTRKVTLTRNQIDDNLDEALCVPAADKKTAAWKKAVELAARAYQDPEKFMKDHRWSIPASQNARDNKVYFYTHVPRAMYHIQTRFDKKLGKMVPVIDPSTKKPKKIIDWTPLTPRLIYPGGPPGGATMPARDNCAAAEFHQPADWSSK